MVARKHTTELSTGGLSTNPQTDQRDRPREVVIICDQGYIRPKMHLQHINNRWWMSDRKWENGWLLVVGLFDLLIFRRRTVDKVGLVYHNDSLRATRIMHCDEQTA